MDMVWGNSSAKNRITIAFRSVRCTEAPGARKNRTNFREYYVGSASEPCGLERCRYLPVDGGSLEYDSARCFLRVRKVGTQGVYTL